MTNHKEQHMKLHFLSAACLTGLLFMAAAGQSQSYSIDWHKIAGGGGVNGG